MTMSSLIQLSRRRNGRRISVVLLMVLAPLIVLLSGGYAGLRLNLTPSAPLGLWRIAKLERPVAVGDRVFVCLPLAAAMREGLRRGYLRKGLCPGFVAPVIKRVAAGAGQHIAVSAFIEIDGQRLCHSNLMTFDSRGRPLAAHPGGIIPEGHVYLHSDHVGSFDSRYFGPMPVASILGLAEEVITRDP